MIPIQLTLEGLYSYQERQKINFENLTEAGLFGIFGSVGSENLLFWKPFLLRCMVKPNVLIPETNVPTI